MQVRAGTEALNGEMIGVWGVPGLRLEAQCVQRLFLCFLHVFQDRQRKRCSGWVSDASQVCGRGMETFKVGAGSLLSFLALFSSWPASHRPVTPSPVTSSRVLLLSPGLVRAG